MCIGSLQGIKNHNCRLYRNGLSRITEFSGEYPKPSVPGLGLTVKVLVAGDEIKLAAKGKKFLERRDHTIAWSGDDIPAGITDLLIFPGVCHLVKYTNYF